MESCAAGMHVSALMRTRDKIQFAVTALYLHKSTIDACLADLETEQVHDLNQLIGKERDKTIDLHLARLLEYVVKNDKTGIARRAARQHKDRAARKIKRNALRKR